MLFTGSCASIIGSHEELHTNCILFVPCLHAIAMGSLMQYMYLYEVCVCVCVCICVHTHTQTRTLAICHSNWGAIILACYSTASFSLSCLVSLLLHLYMH